MSAADVEHQHRPIRVVDDLDLDEAGRPAKWWWHLECLGCGEVLDLVVEPARAGVAR